MKRIFLMLTVAMVMAATLVMAGPASAQGGGCKAFGQTTAANTPLNDTVAAEQAAPCEPNS